MNSWIRRSVQVGTVSAGIVLTGAAAAHAAVHQDGRVSANVVIVNQVGHTSSTPAGGPTPTDDSTTNPGIPAGAKVYGGQNGNAVQPETNTNPGTPTGARPYGESPAGNAAQPADTPTAPSTGAPTAGAPAAGAPTAGAPTGGGGPTGGADGRPLVVRPIVVLDDDDDDDFFRPGFGPGFRGGNWHRWDDCDGRGHHRHRYGHWGCGSFHSGHGNRWCDWDDDDDRCFGRFGRRSC